MSLSEIKTKTEKSLNDIYTALSEKGADIPEQQNLVNVAPTVKSITGGLSSGQYVWAKYSEKPEIEIPINTKVLLHFENNVNDSIGIITPVEVGTVTYEAGKIDNAINLNQIGCVKIPYNNNIVFEKNDFTIAGWFCISENTGYWQTLMAHFDTSGIKLSYSPSLGAFMLRIASSNDTYIIEERITTTLNLGVWYHIAIVRSGSTFYLFVNGEIKKTVTSSVSVYQPTIDFFIGDNSEEISLNCLKGKVDEFIIVNGSALWNDNFTPPTQKYDNGIIEGYVVSDNATAYPNDDYAEDGYYYKKGFVEDDSEETLEKFIPLEYIESTGTQYIDTGVPASKNIKVEINVENLDTSKSSHIFGSRTGVSNSAINIAYMNESWGKGWSFAWGNETQQTQDEISTMRTYVLGNNEAYINGTLIHNFSTQTFSNTYPMYIFTTNNAGTPHTQYSNIKLYSCKIYDNNILIRDLRPCYRESNGEVGLFDMVRGRFYRNMGTGEFVAGQEVAA